MNSQDIKRISRVANVLFKHGMGYFVQELGLKWRLLIFRQLVSAKKVSPETMPERLRKAMEELGGAYVKLGQLLSLRPDLVPEEYCAEFRKLLDKMEPMPFERAKKIVEEELKQPLKNIFAEFDKKPIGSASIAQVHLAKLKNGKKVAVKIQRPDAEKQFMADIDIMHYLAHKIENKFKQKTISPTLIVQEFERYTRDELNFLNEAKNIDAFYKNFRNSKKVKIPQVYWQYSTSKLITMEYISGTKLSELNNKINKKAIALAIADAMFEQVFTHDLFHADMHPGNILLLDDGRIALLDFGIVSSLGSELRKKELEVYAGLINKDAPATVKALLQVGTPTGETDLESFAAETERIINEWHGKKLSESRVTHMLHKLFTNCIKHKIRMPVPLLLLGKALVTLEGTCLQLDPDFNFVEYSMPKIQKILRKEKSPKAVIDRFVKKSAQISRALSQLPEETLALVEKLKKGKIEFDMEDTDVKHLGMDINTSSNRLAYALVIAALLVSGAILAETKPAYAGYSLFTLVAITIAGILMLSLLVSIFKEGSQKYDPHKKEVKK